MHFLGSGVFFSIWAQQGICAWSLKTFLLWTIKWYSLALIWGFIFPYIFIALQYNPTVFQENTSDRLFVVYCLLASPKHSVQCNNQAFTFIIIVGLHLIMKHWFPHFFIFAMLYIQQWHTLVKSVLSQLRFWTTPEELQFSVICRSSKEYWKCIICQIHKLNILPPKSIFF